MNTLFIIFILVFMALFAYVSSVVVEEQKRGKRIPLIWEREFWDKAVEQSFQKKANKLFMKNNVKYTDGDNT